MKNKFFILITIFAISPLLTLAHGATETDDHVNNMTESWGGMMGWGWMGWISTSLIFILIFVAIIALIVWTLNQIKK